MKIYLAGGTKTDWQDIVKSKAKHHEYYDPRIDTDQKYNFQIIKQDLGGIDWSDLLFAYFEIDNPSGIGLSVEVGYALARNKRIIIVDEHEVIHVFLASCCERLFTSFNKAVEYLNAIRPA